jgi:hypothetical protein
VARLIAFLAVAIIAAATLAAAVTDPPASGAHVLDLVALAIGITTPACVGLVLLERRPGTVVAWILLAGAFSVAVVMGAFLTAAVTLSDDSDSALGAWALVVATEWLVLFAWPLALAFVYPDSRLPSARWRPAAWVAVASFGIAMLLLPFGDPLEGPYGDVPNPLPGLNALEPLFWVCWFGVLISLVSGALALRARYATYRRQVLWLAYGALLPPVWLGGTSLV